MRTKIVQEQLAELVEQRTRLDILMREIVRTQPARVQQLERRFAGQQTILEAERQTRSERVVGSVDVPTHLEDDGLDAFLLAMLHQAHIDATRERALVHQARTDKDTAEALDGPQATATEADLLDNILSAVVGPYVDSEELEGRCDAVQTLKRQVTALADWMKKRDPEKFARLRQKRTSRIAELRAVFREARKAAAQLVESDSTYLKLTLERTRRRNNRALSILDYVNNLSLEPEKKLCAGTSIIALSGDARRVTLTGTFPDGGTATIHERTLRDWDRAERKAADEWQERAAPPQA